MPSVLCEAMLRCHARRLRERAAAAPLLAVVIVLALGAAPVVLARMGASVGERLAATGLESRIAEAVVLGPVLAAMALGAAFALTLPGRSELASHVAAAPIASTAVVVATLVPLTLTGAVCAIPSAVAVCLGVGSALPGGSSGGLAVAAGCAAAIPAGALVTEVVLGAARGRRWPLPALLAVSGGWGLLGAAAGSVPLGPLALCAGALAGSSSAVLALVVSAVVTVGLASAWLVLAASRPPARVGKSRSTRQLVRFRPLVLEAAMTVLLTRRREARVAALAALAFGGCGVVVARIASASPPAGFLLATSTALLGSVVASLMTTGVLLDGAWCWRRAPIHRSRVATGSVTVAASLTALPVVLVGIVAAAVCGATPATIGVVLAITAVAAACGLVAGCVLPWHRSGAGDQLASFAVFAAIAIAASLVVGVIGPRLVVVGLPGPVVVVGLCGTAAAVAVVVTGVVARGEQR